MERQGEYNVFSTGTYYNNGQNLSALNPQSNNFSWIFLDTLWVSIFASMSPCLTTLSGNGAQTARLRLARADHR